MKSLVALVSVVEPQYVDHAPTTHSLRDLVEAESWLGWIAYDVGGLSVFVVYEVSNQPPDHRSHLLMIDGVFDGVRVGALVDVIVGVGVFVGSDDVLIGVGVLVGVLVGVGVLVAADGV